MTNSNQNKPMNSSQTANLLRGERVITSEEFNEGLHKHHEIERGEFLRQPLEERIPKLVIWIRNKNDDATNKDQMILCVLAGNFDSGENERKMMMGLGAKVAEQGHRFPVAVYLQSEAWVSTSMDKEAIKNGNYIEPRLDPNHTEVLMTSGMTIDGRQNMAISSIQTKGKKARFLLEPNYTDYKADNQIDLHSDLIKQFYLGYSLYMGTKGDLFKDDQTN